MIRGWGAGFRHRLPEKHKSESRKQKSGFPNFSFPNSSFSPKDPVMVVERRKAAFEPDCVLTTFGGRGNTPLSGQYSFTA
jgi:hypothetical protein